MVYEAVRDIAAGEELLLGVREPLQLQDMLGENTTEDRSDRETGEYPIRRSSHGKGRGLPLFPRVIAAINQRERFISLREPVTRANKEGTRWKFACLIFFPFFHRPGKIDRRPASVRQLT